MVSLVAVLLKTRLAGSAGNYAPGSVVRVAPLVAASLVDGGFAEYVDPPAASSSKGMEEAVIEAPERAVSRRQRGARRTRKKSEG